MIMSFRDWWQAAQAKARTMAASTGQGEWTHGPLPVSEATLPQAPVPSSGRGPMGIPAPVKPMVCLRMDVRPVQINVRGNTLTWWHWNVTDSTTGQMYAYGKRRRESVAWSDAGSAFKRWTEMLNV